MTFEATRESLEAHQVPDWYHDDKLDIFIHWGLFSIPVWAPRTDINIVELFAAEGMEAIKKTPYAEWYLNSMQFEDYPTWKHHRETYGPDHSYYDFQESFETESAKMRPRRVGRPLRAVRRPLRRPGHEASRRVSPMAQQPSKPGQTEPAVQERSGGRGHPCG